MSTATLSAQLCATPPATHRVDADQAIEVALFSFRAEASELGIPPGCWPNQIQTSLGNGQPFLLIDVDLQGNGRYRQNLGALDLTIWND